MSLDFDLTAKRIKNLKVLQSINANAFEIVEDVSHVALYKYESGSGARWERVDVEGSAFVTRNKESPFYSLMILNKKGPTDFVLDLTTKIKVKVQDIYVMVRCNAEVIFGLWFHNEEERSSLFQSLKRITCAESAANVNGAFTASLLKLQAQAAAKDSPTSKEPAEKLKYSDIVTKQLKDETKASAPVSSSNSPMPDSNGVSPTNCSTAKKNMLLSALKPSVSENELKDKSNVTVVTSSDKPVGLSMSENNLGRLLLEGLSSKKSQEPKPENNNSTTVNDVKKVLFSENGSSTTTAAAERKGTSNGIALTSTDCESGEDEVVTSGSARLLNLLKASGRTPSTSSGSSPVGLSSRDSPVPVSTTPVPTSNGTGAAAPMSEAQKSDRLLSMLKHATTSNQAMDLLTDGDIAARQSKTGTTASTTTAAVETISKKTSSDKLMSMLKSPATSTVTTPVNATSVSPVSVKDLNASKENLLKNLLSVNGVTPVKTPDVTAATAPVSAPSSAGRSSEERSVTLLSSLASSVTKSPELRSINGSSVTVKSASPSTIPTSATVPVARKPMPVLLSPSDLAKLAVA